LKDVKIYHHDLAKTTTATDNTFGALPTVDFVKPLYLFLGSKVKWTGAKDCHYTETRPDCFSKPVRSSERAGNQKALPHLLHSPWCMNTRMN